MLWGIYDMFTLRTAWNQESMDNVTVFKHDNLFNNWINPKVMAAYTENPQKSWGTSYGFQYVKEQTVVHGVANSTKDCHMKCIQMVSFFNFELIPSGHSRKWENGPDSVSKGVACSNAVSLCGYLTSLRIRAMP